MRDDGYVIGSGHRVNLLGLRQATHPGDVRLQNVDTTSLYELAEAIAGVFVFARSEKTDVTYTVLVLALWCVALCCAVLCCAVLCCAVLCCAVLYLLRCGALCCVALRCVVVYCVVLCCCAVLVCSAVLWCGVLCVQCTLCCVALCCGMRYVVLCDGDEVCVVLCCYTYRSNQHIQEIQKDRMGRYLCPNKPQQTAVPNCHAHVS